MDQIGQAHTVSGFQPAGDNVLVRVVFPGSREAGTVGWGEVVAVGPELRPTVTGTWPAAGSVVVANHASYIDGLMLAADGTGFPAAIRLRDRARAAILAECGEPDAGP